VSAQRRIQTEIIQLRGAQVQRHFPDSPQHQPHDHERIPNARPEKPFDANALRSLVGERVAHRAPPARPSAATAAGS